VHRTSFFTVSIVDSALLLLGHFLASAGTRSWLVAAPALAINAPAVPLAVFFSVFGKDPQSIWITLAMNASIIIVSSVAWGAIVASAIKSSSKFTG
jgi:hypothetical protein